jgi:Raf kinase inhibitor-like YbhB/YbcL family protein
MAFRLRSPAFRQAAPIPVHHTCDGFDRAPALAWDQVPDSTQSFALIGDNADAPSGTFTHWVLFDIPADVRELREGQDDIGRAGMNDFQRPTYSGPCPPPRRGDHRYVFTLYALDIPRLNVQHPASRRMVEAAMAGHVLDQIQLMGRYART